ncbi:MAG TPA: LysR family transcriptional regulator [Caulobacteraceae bacterium]|nr:LysR family transcriptional regulator [Caulobacteraceae bacterium]
MDWDNYRAFLEVYRSGDLGHAAHGLEMSVPTVRRRLDAVESTIGFPLFERTPRGLSPTPVARRLVHSIAAMGDFAAVAGTLKEGPVQYVAISADEALAHFISATTWAGLRRSHPGVGISILTRRPNAEVLELRADVAISHLRPKSGRAAVRSPGALEIGLFAHRDYLSRAGTPETVADLQRFCMVAAESDEAKAWMDARFGLPAGSTRCALRTDSYVARIAAIEAGIGIGVCYVGLARRRPELVRVLPTVAASLDCWLWSPRSQPNGGAASQVIDSLLTALSDEIGSSQRARTVRLATPALNDIAA